MSTVTRTELTKHGSIQYLHLQSSQLSRVSINNYTIERPDLYVTICLKDEESQTETVIFIDNSVAKELAKQISEKYETR